MNDVCAACGKRIYTIRARGMGITLAREWVHQSWLANRNHRPIPKNHEFKLVDRL